MVWVFMGNKDSFDFPDIAFDFPEPQADLFAADPGVNKESVYSCPDKRNIAVRAAGKTA